MPANPAGWLVTTAWRAALDQLRRAAVGRQKLALLANEPQPEFSDPADDDTLALIFGCCHPAVDPSAQIALTLHAVGGLTTAEIAAAFLNARQARTWDWQYDAAEQLRATALLGRRAPEQTLATNIAKAHEGGHMALRYLGKDPDSDHGNSPTVWEDGDSYVVQGWRITDTTTLAEIGSVPSHETVVRIPKRLMAVFPEVSGGGSGSEAG